MRQTTPSRYLYVLPNLFTFGSLFAGFYVITLLSTPDLNGATLLTASLALLFACICDGLDGRVARWTNTASDFGMHMDSLVDLVSFGVAPAFLIYKWALEPFGLVGQLVAFAFAGAGAFRLARFNAMESAVASGKEKKGPSRFFVGLPIPMAAGTMIAVLMTVNAAQEGIFAVPSQEGSVGALFLTLALSYLMVSNVRFRTFKDLRFTPAVLVVVALVGGLMTTGAVLVQTPFAALLVAFCIYLTLGLVGSTLGRLSGVSGTLRANR